MSEKPMTAAEMIETLLPLCSEGERILDERRKQEFAELAARYDDALKRINDLEAELEHLRREVNR